MSRKIILKAAVLCGASAALALAACKATDTGGGSAASVGTARTASTPAQKGPQQQPTQPPNTATAERVSISELQALMEKGDVVVVDVRSKASYDAGHIKGAIVIPDNEIEARAGELPRDKKIVTYCA